MSVKRWHYSLEEGGLLGDAAGEYVLHTDHLAAIAEARRGAFEAGWWECLRKKGIYTGPSNEECEEAYERWCIRQGGSGVSGAGSR